MKSHKLWIKTHISNLLYSLEYVSINILQERMNICYAYLWFGMNLQTQTNHHFSDGTKSKKKSVMKHISIQALTHKKWTNKSTGHKQRWRQPSIETSQDLSLDADVMQGTTHLILANRRPTFIVFEDTILHIGSMDKDDEMPLQQGMHPCVNKHQSMVDCRLCLERPLTTTVARWHL
jgi:hypothetical protein